MGLHGTAQYFSWPEACSFMSVFTLLRHDVEVGMPHAGILEFNLVGSSRSAPLGLFMYLIQVLRALLDPGFQEQMWTCLGEITWEGKKTGVVILWLGLLGEEKAACGQASGDWEGQELSHQASVETADLGIKCH